MFSYSSRLGRWAILWLVLTPVADASPAAEASAVEACQQPNALSAVSCELARALRSLGSRHPGSPGSKNQARSTLVCALDLEQSEPAERRAKPSRTRELSRRLATVTAGQLEASAGPVVTSLAEARLAARGYQHILLLQPKLRGAHFDVAADLYELPSNFWDRVKAPKRAAVAHAFATRPADAEIHSFLPTIPLVVSRIDRAELPAGTSPAGAAQALGCSDLDGDGSLDLVLATRHALYRGRLRGGRFDPSASVEWNALSAVAPAPLRQPITLLALRAGRFLDVGSTDRADWVRLSPELQLLERRPALLPWPGGGCTQRRDLGLATRRVGCLDERVRHELQLPALADALSSADYVTPTGQWRHVVAARPLGADYWQLHDDAGRRVQLPGAGAQAALADLNRDGVLDVAYGRDVLDPRQDALQLASWQPHGLRQAATVPVPDGIRALTACPAESAGLAPLALATSNELWVLR